MLCAEGRIVEVKKLTSTGWRTFEYFGDEIIVKPKEWNVVSASAKVSEKTRSSLADNCDSLGVCYIAFQGDVRALSATVEELNSDVNFEWATLSPVLRTRQAPTGVSSSQYPNASAQWNLFGSLPGSIGFQIRPAKNADNLYVVSLDTGMSLTHESINYSRNKKENNFNGTVPDSATDEAKAYVGDDNGHGTATVTGVIAQKGIVGTFNEAKFWVMKVLERDGTGKTQNIVRTILRLAEQVGKLPAGSRVVALMCFGSEERVLPIEAAMQIAQRAGVIFVVAAGNRGNNADLFPETPTTTDGVIAVGGCGYQGEIVRRTYFSSTFGPKTVLVCAPAVDIAVAVPKPSEGSYYDPYMSDPFGYKRGVDGTSFAVPQVAGIMLAALDENPTATLEEIKFRLMNGKRTMPSETILEREYGGCELFTSCGGLSWTGALVEKSTPPPQPILTSVVAGHSAIRVELDSSSKPAAVRCYHGNIGEQKVMEINPYLGGPILVRGLDGTPLTEETPTDVACQVADATGQWSRTSVPVSVITRKSVSQELSLGSFTRGFGPLGDIISQIDPNTQVLWTETEFPFFGRSLYAGNPRTINYRVGNNDSVVDSAPFLVPEFASIDLDTFVQMFGTGPQGSHFDKSSISVLYQENGKVREVTLVEIVRNNTSLGLEKFSLDVSQFAGKTIQIRFRFFTNGSSVGIGWIVSKVTLRTI